jgi:hypothetical protein
MDTLHAMENFEQLTRCPICSNQYSGKEVTILEESEKQSTFHLSCSGCGVALMVFISTGQFGIVSVGMITDLNTNEAKNFYKTESITADQVIEVHEYLKNI